MAQIQILDHVVYSDGSTNPIAANITHEGCIVEYSDLKTNVYWDEMADVEQLSEIFADTSVRVFKVVVQMLGKIYAGRDAYKLLV